MLTHDEFIDRMVQDYGEAGLCAAEGSCLTQFDLDRGWEHCLERCLPALEEEMMSRGELG